MNNKALDGILKLKKSLVNNRISIDEAIEEFTKLLTFHQDSSKIDEEIFIIKKTISTESLNLIKEINTLEKKIARLNRVIILQELGVKFMDEEMAKILGS